MLPGYKYVDEFGPDEEYEDDIEIAYVTLDLGANVDQALLPNTSEYRVAGLDTSTPMLQLSGTFFKGAHEDLIGTELLFTDGRDETNPSRRFVVPVGTTERRIKFEQVEVKSREEVIAAQAAATRQRAAASKKPAKATGRGRGRRKGRGKGGSGGSIKGKEREVPIDVDVTSNGE